MAERKLQERSERVSIGARIVAFLLDYVLIAGYLAVLFVVSFPAQPLIKPLFTTSPLTAELSGFLIITLPVYLYFAVCEGSKSHATWGKRKMGIAVAGVRDRPVGLGTSLLRSALKLAPWELAHFAVWHIVIPSELPASLVYTALATVYVLVFAYVISPFWNPRRQTIYDSIAGTVVTYSK
ncbi:RDD family protein [Paenibacillus sp. GYB003]